MYQSQQALSYMKLLDNEELKAQQVSLKYKKIAMIDYFKLILVV